MSCLRTSPSLITLSLLLFLSVLAGCSRATQPPSPTAEPLEPTQVETEAAAVRSPAAPSPTVPSPAVPSPEPGGYPGPATPTPFDYTNEGYAAPETTPFVVELPENLAIPEPEEDTGLITGQLLTPGPGGEPYYGALFLADTINSDQEGMPPIIAFSEATAPRAQQDKTGRFLFTDIPPGSYSLVIWNPVGSTVIPDPETDDYLVFEVIAGEVTDLGVIGIP